MALPRSNKKKNPNFDLPMRIYQNKQKIQGIKYIFLNAKA